MNIDTEREDEALARHHLGRRAYTETGGTPVEQQKGRRWTRGLVILAFRGFNMRHGRPPKYAELGSEGLPWARTVERLFEGGFNDAVRAAGFTPRPVGHPRRRPRVRTAA